MIKIVNLYKSFGRNQVLSGVDLDIETGETMVVIGQSGSGKSVLIKHLIGLLKPDSGEIFIDGMEITRLNEHALQRQGRAGVLAQPPQRLPYPLAAPQQPVVHEDAGELVADRALDQRRGH